VRFFRVRTIWRRLCAAVAVNDERVRLLMTMPGLTISRLPCLLLRSATLIVSAAIRSWFLGPVWLLAYASLAIRLCVEELLGRGTGLFVGFWFRLLRRLDFMMIGSGSSMSVTRVGRVIRRRLLLLLMRC